MKEVPPTGSPLAVELTETEIPSLTDTSIDRQKLLEKRGESEARSETSGCGV